MATKWLEDEAEQAQVFQWREDKKTGKVSKFKIRPVPPSWDRHLRDRVFGSSTYKKLEQQKAAERMERTVRIVRERAAYALVDSIDFTVEAASAGAAATLTDLLGEEIATGQEVCLDGKLTDKVKAKMLEAIPLLADWISTKADEMLEADAQEEEELGKT